MKLNALVVTAALTARNGYAADYYVDASRFDDTGDGTHWSAAKKTIQAAVDLTGDGDTVWITNGVIELSSAITVSNAITIRSTGGPDNVIEYKQKGSM